MSTKEIQEELLNKMKQWQKIEDAAAASTGQIMEKTENPLIHLVMEIIQSDSRLHHQVQGFVAATLESKAVSLDPDEMASVWGAIEEHIALEKRMAGYVDEALTALRGKKMLVQEYLLNYLKADEAKHDKLLEDLEAIKKGMYPYG